MSDHAHKLAEAIEKLIDEKQRLSNDPDASRFKRRRLIEAKLHLVAALADALGEPSAPDAPHAAEQSDTVPRATESQED